MTMASNAYYNHIVQKFETDPELKKTAMRIFKHLAYTATGTTVGGVLGGPVGAALGFVVGAGIGYWMVFDYDSMVKVLREMSDEQKKKLVGKTQAMIRSSSTEAFTNFIQAQETREELVKMVVQVTSEVKAEAA